MVIAKGWENGDLVFNEFIVSVEKDENFLHMNTGNDCPTI